MTPARRAAALVAAGLLGFVLVFVVALALRRPELVDRWRYGTAREDGVLMLLERGVAAPTSLTLAFKNVGGASRALFFPEGDRAGVEVDVIVTDEQGRRVEPEAPPFDPVTPEARPRQVTLEPGTEERLPLDLARFVKLAPGRWRVHVERARLNKMEPRLRSNEIVVEIK